MLSSTLEHYLLVIYMAKLNQEEITCRDIAKKLNQPIKQVMQAVQRLHYQKYIDYSTCQPIEINKNGIQFANYLITRDRIVEQFLTVLDITENYQLEKEALCQYLTQETLIKLEKFVLFTSSNPQFVREYKLFLQANKESILLKYLS
ncbi:MAG: hypothetical protein ATN32_08440 [Candidatus Epulonipiscium fishelsonii]|nr:MAG: hypothetical protein ATN32_08440 [Epulopiscium sp. AS2M-Bin002]